jgi:hypothetical protein
MEDVAVCLALKNEEFVLYITIFEQVMFLAG